MQYSNINFCANGRMTGTRFLVADIGATNARFGLLDASGRLLHTQTLPCIGHKTLEEAARAYLDVAQPELASSYL